jgi:hypothetical protein
MGDYLLMKTLLLLIFISSSLLADANTDWVDGQVAAIKPPRKGVSSNTISRVKNPFIITYSASTTGEKSSTPSAGKSTVKQTGIQPLKVHAIMNDSALINGKWYKADEKVQGYRVAKIDRESVLLTSGKKEKKLFLSSANSKIQIQIK